MLRLFNLRIINAVFCQLEFTWLALVRENKVKSKPYSKQL
jgi:hypothetical protein